MEKPVQPIEMDSLRFANARYRLYCMRNGMSLCPYGTGSPEAHAFWAGFNNQPSHRPEWYEGYAVAYVMDEQREAAIHYSRMGYGQFLHEIADRVKERGLKNQFVFICFVLDELVTKVGFEFQHAKRLRMAVQAVVKQSAYLDEAIQHLPEYAGLNKVELRVKWLKEQLHKGE